MKIFFKICRTQSKSEILKRFGQLLISPASQPPFAMPSRLREACIFFLKVPLRGAIFDHFLNELRKSRAARSESSDVSRSVRAVLILTSVVGRCSKKCYVTFILATREARSPPHSSGQQQRQHFSRDLPFAVRWQARHEARHSPHSAMRWSPECIRETNNRQTIVYLCSIKFDSRVSL